VTFTVVAAHDGEAIAITADAARAYHAYLFIKSAFPLQPALRVGSTSDSHLKGWSTGTATQSRYWFKRRKAHHLPAIEAAIFSASSPISRRRPVGTAVKPQK
jgi:hypothetical protein